MKKFLFFCLLLVAFNLMAQQSIFVRKGIKPSKGITELSMMNNLDFETWYTDPLFGLGDQPDGWEIISCKPTQQKTTDKQHGSYAVYLETGIVNLPMLEINDELMPGMIAGTDAITTAAPPTAMTFWAKGTLLGNDIAQVLVSFIKGDEEEEVGYLTLSQTDLGDTYKQFTIDLSYEGSKPESVYVEASSGGGDGSSGITAGSKMYFDNVEFIYGPVATVTPDSWNAGNVGVGSNATKNFTLTNTGEGTLTVSMASSLVAPWATNFNASSVSLNSGQTYSFTISFTPTAAENYNTLFTITSNGGTKTISLNGTGVIGNPELVSFTPEDAAVDVVLNAEVSVTFNMNIASSQLQEITIAPDPGGVVPQIIDNKLIIAHNDFTPYTPYIIAIPFDVIDGYENPIGWGFATGNTVNSLPTINKNDVKIYPNPSSNGTINVKTSENSVVKVFDLSGKLIKVYDNVEANTVLNFTMPIGMYFVQVESAGGVKINKIIIQ